MGGREEEREGEREDGEKVDRGIEGERDGGRKGSKLERERGREGGWKRKASILLRTM